MHSINWLQLRKDLQSIVDTVDQKRLEFTVDFVQYAKDGSDAAFEIIKCMLLHSPVHMSSMGQEILKLLLPTLTDATRNVPSSVVQCVAQVQKILDVDQYSEMMSTLFRLMSSVAVEECQNENNSYVTEIILAMCKEADPKILLHIEQLICTLQKLFISSLSNASKASSFSEQDSELRLCCRYVNALECLCIVGAQSMKPAMVQEITEFALNHISYIFVESKDVVKSSSSSDSGSDTDSTSTSNSDSDDGWGESTEDYPETAVIKNMQNIQTHEGSANVRSTIANLLTTLISYHSGQLKYFAGQIMNTMEQFEKAFQFQSQRSQASVFNMIASLWKLVTLSRSQTATLGSTNASRTVDEHNYENAMTHDLNRDIVGPPLVLQRQLSGRQLVDHLHIMMQTITNYVLPANRAAMLSLFSLMVPALKARPQVAVQSCRDMLQQIQQSVNPRSPHNQIYDVTREKILAFELFKVFMLLFRV